MIDSHSHTFYSKHAKGTVDELVRASIAAGVSILTITDHAPFPVDRNNRLLDSELDQYFSDIDRARELYRGDIKILRGLEIDFLPGSNDFNLELLSRYPIDYVIGSIHYVEVPGEHIFKVWELDRLSNEDFLDHYFANLNEMLGSGLIDAVGHADTLLRSVSEEVIIPRFEPIIKTLSQQGIAFELNTSALRKLSVNPLDGKEELGLWTYPSATLFEQMLSHKIPFTIGSDAHEPCDAGAGISETIRNLIPYGLKTLSYYERRQRFDIDVENCDIKAQNKRLVEDSKS
jgi:histidinol-phosphatase (PHP family)